MDVGIRKTCQPLGIDVGQVKPFVHADEPRSWHTIRYPTGQDLDRGRLIAVGLVPHSDRGVQYRAIR